MNLKIVEGWGTGLPRLFRQCRERGLPEPSFKEYGDGIKVVIYRKSGSEQISDSAQSTTQTTQSTTQTTQSTTQTTQSTTQTTQLSGERKLSTPDRNYTKTPAKK